MKERPAVGGRKPLNNHLERVEEEREDSSRRGPIEDPRTSELDHGTTSGRATNDMIERQARPIATTGRRTRHGSDKGAQTQDEAFEAAPKWLILHPKQKGTAGPPPRMQKLPQLPYTMTAPSNYRRKSGSSTPHIEETLPPHSRDNGRLGEDKRPHTRISRLARQPHSPLSASGQRRTATASMTASGHENGERDR